MFAFPVAPLIENHIRELNRQETLGSSFDSKEVVNRTLDDLIYEEDWFRTVDPDFAAYAIRTKTGVTLFHRVPCKDTDFYSEELKAAARQSCRERLYDCVVFHLRMLDPKPPTSSEKGVASAPQPT